MNDRSNSLVTNPLMMSQGWRVGVSDNKTTTRPLFAPDRADSIQFFIGVMGGSGN